MNKKQILALSLPLLYLGCQTTEQKNESKKETQPVNGKPNIVVVLCDDMGYSDIGSFGAEIIKTPNLDTLAVQGMRLTRFYNTARCCPSRAALLTGQHPHTAGMGSMTDQTIDLPAYHGYFPQNVTTISQVLKNQGYNTYLAGKWHVGDEPEHWPMNYGFTHCFSNIKGAGSYFDGLPYRNDQWKWGGNEIIYVEDEKQIEYPKGKYLTDLITDYALKYITEAKEANKPFFLYLAYTAPHWPLHAPEDVIAKYENKFLIGWDSLRALRYKNQLKKKIIQPHFKLSKRNSAVRAWDELSADEKQKKARLMAVYAAMIDRMDQNLGRLRQQLKQNRQDNNTIIVFLSDNGGCRAEYVSFLDKRFDKNALPGTPQSFTAYGAGWANASNTPFRMFKSQVHEGGIASPFIAWYPKMIPANTINRSIGHIADILPTCLELAGATYPNTHNNTPIVQSPGQSLISAFKGDTLIRKQPLGFEHHGTMAIRDGKWKMVRLKNKPWELYDMENDPTETNDLIKTADEKIIDHLMKAYNQWSAQVGACPSDVVKNRRRIE